MENVKSAAIDERACMQRFVTRHVKADWQINIPSPHEEQVTVHVWLFKLSGGYCGSVGACERC